jgi:hypothetical protein
MYQWDDGLHFSPGGCVTNSKIKDKLAFKLGKA